MTEAQIQREIIDLLTTAGWYVMAVPNRPESRKVVGFRAGVSDLIALKNGRIFFLEVKQPGKGPRKEQVAFAAKVRRHAFPYAIVTSAEQALEAVA